MTTNESVQVLIIGGGPAGYTAAMYAARGGLSPVLVEGHAPGGQFLTSPRVDCFPSYPGGIAGKEICRRRERRCRRYVTKTRR